MINGAIPQGSAEYTFSEPRKNVLFAGQLFPSTGKPSFLCQKVVRASAGGSLHRVQGFRLSAEGTFVIPTAFRASEKGTLSNFKASEPRQRALLANQLPSELRQRALLTNQLPSESRKKALFKNQLPSELRKTIVFADLGLPAPGSLVTRADSLRPSLGTNMDNANFINSFFYKLK